MKRKFLDILKSEVKRIKHGIDEERKDFDSYADSATYGLAKEYRKHYSEAYNPPPKRRKRPSKRPRVSTKKTKPGSAMPLRRRYRKRRVSRRRYNRRRIRRYRRRARRHIRTINAVVGETKRHLKEIGGEVTAIQRQVVIDLNEVPRVSSLLTTSDHVNKRMGNQIFARGIKVYLTLFSRASRDIYIRMFFGHWRGEHANEGIYRSHLTGLHGTLEQMAPDAVDTLNVQIDKKRYKVLRHKTIKMTGQEDDDGGMSTRHIKFWIPLNRTIHFEAESTINVNTIPNISFRMLWAPADVANQANTTPVFRYDMKSVLFFKDN